MTSRLERFLTIVLTMAAVAVAISAVRNSFFGVRTDGIQPPDYVKPWKDGLAIGHLVDGDSLAPVTIMTFYDLQCPACAGFHPTLEKVVAARPKVVRAVYVNQPLPYHKYAVPAARAAECAAEDGHFKQWADVIFAERDSLGRKGWGEYARQAGIADTGRIAACAASTLPNPRIDAGTALATRISTEGTPTVVINGWRLHRTPSAAALDSAIDAVLHGGHPK
jgi:protein-disulfide isomerase